MSSEVAVQRTADLMLAEKYGGQAPGTTIPYAEIESVSGFKYPTDRFWRCVKKLRRHLLRGHQRGTEIIKRTGLLIVPAREHVRLAGGYTSKASRAAKRACEVLAETRVDELSVDERTRHVESLAHAEVMRLVNKTEGKKMLGLIAGARPQLTANS
jgi:hypothetical protein